MRYPEPGDLIAGRYRLVEVIGEGGFGIVYRATTEGSDRAVAIKLLKRRPGEQGATSLARFKREMRLIANLEAPETLTLYDFGETADGLPFMVTEFVEGEDLADLLARRGRLSEGEALHVLLQVLYSLREAHQKGVVHRDVKPRNIRLYELNGDPLRVKVLDFGIARSTDPATPKVTKTGNIVGTPRYMAPEQFLSDEVLPQTDVFAVGLVAAEMLLGAEALDRAGPNPVSRRVRLTAADDLSEAVLSLVNRMLEADLSRRFESTEAAIAAVRPLRRGYRRLPRQPRPAPVPAMEHAPAAAQARPQLAEGGRRLAPNLTLVVGVALAMFAMIAVVVASKNSEPTDLRKVTARPALTASQAAAVETAYEQGLEAFGHGDWGRALRRFREVVDSDDSRAKQELRERALIGRSFANLIREGGDIEEHAALFSDGEGGEHVARFLAEELGRGIKKSVRGRVKLLGTWRQPRLRTATKFAQSPVTADLNRLGNALRSNAELGECDDGSTSSLEAELKVRGDKVLQVEILTEAVRKEVRDCVSRAARQTRFSAAANPESSANGRRNLVTTPVRVVLW